jgi:hypothetical protein
MLEVVFQLFRARQGLLMGDSLIRRRTIGLLVIILACLAAFAVSRMHTRTITAGTFHGFTIGESKTDVLQYLWQTRPVTFVTYRMSADGKQTASVRINNDVALEQTSGRNALLASNYWRIPGAKVWTRYFFTFDSGKLKKIVFVNDFIEMP